MSALVQVPTFEDALLGVERTIGCKLPARSATLERPYYAMARKSVKGLVKMQQAESTTRQQDELIRTIAIQASIPEDTLRRLIQPTVQVPTDGIRQVVDANSSDMRQTM